MNSTNIVLRIASVSSLLLIVLLAAMAAGLSAGAAGGGLSAILSLLSDAPFDSPAMETIVWQLRLPRVLTAALAGAVLSAGGLVFQALLKNPLAEPYILGISGGAAIGAIIGILLGLSRFPGISMLAFAGSMGTLLAVLLISWGQNILKNNSLLLAGVVVNAFCSAGIMFLIALTQVSRLHSIMFWLMGDLSGADMQQVSVLALTVIPCFIIIFCLSYAMNLLLMGRSMALSLGVSTQTVIIVLLVATTFMISMVVCQCGLLGFVGLIVPHILRLMLGPDHRVLVPACLLGGGAYMVVCDLLARTLPQQGELPAGVITALIGAPVFIILLRRSGK